MSFSNPQLNYHGNKNLITVDYGSLKVDKTGLATCTAIFKIKQNLWNQLPGLNTAHPIFTFIGVEDYEISYDGGWAIGNCRYAGVNNGEEETDPVYELVVGVSEEPIETHPDFKKFAGDPKGPLNFARFEREASTGGVNRIASKSSPEPTSNALYVFKDFEVFDDKGALNPKAKITSYLDAAQITWRKSFNRKNTITDLNNVGTIQDPEGPFPKLRGVGRNWLNMGTTQSKKGSAYQCSTEWRASGRRGWDKDIYKTAT